MNRRNFLQLSLTAVGAAMTEASGEGAPALKPRKPGGGHRPNILLVITDQQFAEVMSCAGAEDIHTPAMDELAARGVRLARAYTFQPLCVPARTALLTGRPPRWFGTRVNNLEPLVPAGTPTIGRLLADNGYLCAYAGKWHLPIKKEDVALHGFSLMREVDARDDALMPACQDIFRQPRRQPLFLVASIVNPHDICEFARGDLLPNGDIGPTPPPAECPRLPANFPLAPDAPQALARARQLAPRVYPTANWDEGRWRQYRWAYHRLVERADALLQRLIEAVAAAGLLDDTLVIFTSDHGDGCGAHHWNQKTALYEECARVPLLVCGPGVRGRARVDATHAVSTGLDLLPTLCDYMGIAPPPELPGRSWRPLVEKPGPIAGWRDYLVAETEFAVGAGREPSGIRGRMLRTERYKYIVYSEGDHREQLFDLRADPGETRNLVSDPSGRDLLREHRQLLAQWAQRTRDDFPLAKEPSAES